jgi:hypothetical protein
MSQLAWVSVVAIALLIWMHQLQPLRANDLGSVSARWLEEHRNRAHQDR